METSRVTSTDGTSLAVYSEGPTEAPTVLAVHGYPDNASVWDPVMDLLSADHRCVRYDVRGSGASDQPARVASYRLPQLEADLTAVLEAVSPDRPVHLLAHDWGSIQAWQCVTNSGLRDRIASYTSISGPSVNHIGPWVRSNLRLGRQPLGDVGRQLLHSYYIFAFQIPGLAELAWRSGLLDRLVEGAAPGQGYARSLADKLNGLKLYRANLLNRPGHDFTGGADRRYTQVPVQVLAPAGDAFVTSALALEAPVPFVGHLYLRPIRGSHWTPLRHPDLIATAVRQLTAAVETGSTSEELAATRVAPAS